jgi:phosphopantothenoylcysteine decarboxylase/phosphopantothenate--cysteine ligase
MARIVITSGPTRQHLDAVRYLTNSSSGRMGAALAAAALDAGHEVVVVSGPVDAAYPAAAVVVSVTTTDEMLNAAAEAFQRADGLIGAAAPCDYKPVRVEPGKIAKTGDPLRLELVETPDIVATLARQKGSRWVVGFALEAKDHRFRALAKLQGKHCDLMVANGVAAMNSPENEVEVIAPDGSVVGRFVGAKAHVAREIFAVVDERLIRRVGA